MEFKPCCVCGKAVVHGYYGRWGSGGTCSRACEKIQEEKKK